MTRLDDLGLFNSCEWEQLLQTVDKVEQALEAGQALDLTAYLPPPGSPLRLAWLCELIKTELEIVYRQKRGRPLEAYLQRYPELGAAASLPPGLIYEEFLVRHRHGDRPAVDSYQERFPDQFGELLKILDEQGGPAPTGKTRPDLAGTSVGLDPSVRASATAPVRDYLLPVGGGYRLLQRLGSGAFGDVYRATAPDGSAVAVKWTFRSLDDEACQRELDALRTLFQLHHPHLLRTREHHAHNHRLILIMDLAEGSLTDRLRQCRGLGLTGIPEEELLGYFRQAAEALDFLHANKVTHCDIKPENLLLLGGKVQVADFGLAREQDGSTILTSQVGGTPVYMPPETWQNRISFRSDQYSLAASYVELRLGRPLYTATKLSEIRWQHLHGTPDLTPLPPAEQKVLLRALARDTHQRYRSCGDFVEALTRAVRRGDAPAFPGWVVVTVLIAGLLVLAGLVVWWWQH